MTETISQDGVYIKCQHCGHIEEVNTKLFAKIIGGAAVGFGGYAWVGFLFAGTGFALPLCIAIVAGGAAMMAFSDEIANWLSTKYDCPECKEQNWKVYSGKELLQESENKVLWMSNNSLRTEKFDLQNKLDNAPQIERYNAITILDEIEKIYSEAEEYIYVSYGWYNMYCAKQDIDLMRKAIRRGVHIFFYYGIKPRVGYEDEDRERARRTADTIKFLKSNLDSNYTHFQPTDTHIKAILCDKFALEGSHNLMSYRPRLGENPREENTMKITGNDELEKSRQRIATQQFWAGFEKYAYA